MHQFCSMSLENPRPYLVNLDMYHNRFKIISEGAFLIICTSQFYGCIKNRHLDVVSKANFYFFKVKKVKNRKKSFDINKETACIMIVVKVRREKYTMGPSIYYRLFFFRSIAEFFTQIYLNCFVSS